MDTTVFSKLQSLSDRLAQLEADRCACSACKQRDLERARVATYERLAVIAKMTDADERNAAIDALNGSERDTFLRGYATAEMLRAMSPSKRSEYLERLPSAVRDRVLVEDVQIPRTCRVAMSSPSSAWHRDEKITIDHEAARELRVLGLSDHVIAGGGIENHDAYRTLAFTRGQEYRLRVEAVEIIRRYDLRLDESVKANLVSVTEYSEADDRAYLLAQWACTPIYMRDALPPRTRA